MPRTKPEPPASTTAFDAAARAGWRSLRLVEHRQHATADVEAPAEDAQLVSTLLTGWKRMEVRREGHRTALVTAGPGAVSMTPAGQAVRLRWSAGSAEALRHLAVRLPGATMRRVAQETAEDRAGVPSGADRVAVDDPLIAGVLTGLREAARAGADDLYAASAAEFLAVHLLARHARGERTGHEAGPVARLERLLHDRLGDPVDLAELAEEAGLSRYRTLRAFREATGETPARYLTRLRMERARVLLERGTGGIAGIARRCGYADLAQFSRAFRREHGASPTAYRRLHA